MFYVDHFKSFELSNSYYWMEDPYVVAMLCSISPHRCSCPMATNLSKLTFTKISEDKNDAYLFAFYLERIQGTISQS